MTPLEIRLRHDASRALNNLVNHDYEGYESTIIHLMKLLPFADHCSKCCKRFLDRDDFDSARTHVTQEEIDVSCVWPYKRDENAKCFYICPVCGDHWTVGFYGGSENKVVFISMNDVS